MRKTCMKNTNSESFAEKEVRSPINTCHFKDSQSSQLKLGMKIPFSYPHFDVCYS